MRLIRNDPRIRYQGRVHEDVSESLLEAGSPYWPDSGIVIDDIGYVEASERARKRARNLPLLRTACAEQPDAVFPVYKLAQAVVLENLQEAEGVISEALGRLRRLPPNEWLTLPFLPNLIPLIVAHWSAQGRLIDAVQVCREFQPVLGRALDYTTGAALARAGFWDEARRHLKAFLDRKNEDGSSLMETEREAHPARACLYLAWIERMSGDLDQAAHWVERGKALAAPEQQLDLACEAVEIQILGGALQSVSKALDSLSATASRDAATFSKLMYLSAKLAHSVGDIDTALELARKAYSEGNDLAATLLASLEIEAGVADAARLKQLYEAISGRQIDTLAAKLLIGHHLGIAWPHAVPQQCAID